ncbi:MAG TPA: hypothetical protein VGH65_06695 [Verrucomicrobiaceae bacterium]|jgi:hypothetical protein
MQLLLATLCDSAADYQGKLCVLGAFDTLCAPQFPVVHPQCSLAVRMLFDPPDRGRHEVSIRLLDEKMHEIMPAFTPAIDVAFPREQVPFVTRNLVLNLQRLRFDEPGVYRFSISMDGREIASVPLRVARVEERRGSIGPAG